ncbi:MAG: FG-GAP-like repeat-containing protein [Candidatus Hermodarchaeota archaeon]
MNQKTIKFKISLLLIFLISLEIGSIIISSKYNEPIIHERNENVNPITSSSGWGPEIYRSIGMINEIGFDVFVGDANNDGYNDIATANHYTNDLSLLIWNSTTEDWEPYIKKSVGDITRSVTIGDANNDGYNDLLTGWWNITKGRISVFLWNSSINDWDNQIKKNITAEPGNIHVEDIDNDGDNDILVGGYGGDKFSCFFWNETIDNWDHEISQNLTAQCGDVFPGDVNNDGLKDVVASLSSNKVAIFTWNDSLDDWNPVIEKSVGQSPRNVYIKDANNDGYNDIAVINGDDNNVSLYLWNNSLLEWNGEITKSTGDDPYGISINDANNDGYNDIIVGNNNDDDISLHIWNATTNDWNSEIQVSIFFSPIEVFVEDVDNDGLKDIVSAGFDTRISILLSYIDTPILDPISPSIDYDGFIDLNWNDVAGVSHYYIYRDTSEIYSVDGLDPIATVFDSSYTDYTPFNGWYYYVVVASDGYKNSSISDYQQVDVDVPIDAPQLEPIVPSVDTDGIIYLDWDDVDRIQSYYIFRETSFITSIDSLFPYDVAFESNYIDIINRNGIYYYVIYPGEYNAPISNCEEITVGIPLETPNLERVYHTGGGFIEVVWSEVDNATLYYVYRANSTILSVDGLTPIVTVPSDVGQNITYYNQVYETGNYFYAVVATDGYGISSPSNSLGVYVEIESGGPISGYNLYFILATFFLFAFMIFAKTFKKKN